MADCDKEGTYLISIIAEKHVVICTFCQKTNVLMPS